VISGIICLEADSFVNHKSDGLGFGLADALGSFGAPLLLMQQWLLTCARACMCHHDLELLRPSLCMPHPPASLPSLGTEILPRKSRSVEPAFCSSPSAHSSNTAPRFPNDGL